jgi:hypothetical protein
MVQTIGPPRAGACRLRCSKWNRRRARTGCSHLRRVRGRKGSPGRRRPVGRLLSQLYKGRFWSPSPASTRAVRLWPASFPARALDARIRTAASPSQPDRSFPRRGLAGVSPLPPRSLGLQQRIGLSPAAAESRRHGQVCVRADDRHSPIERDLARARLAETRAGLLPTGVPLVPPATNPSYRLKTRGAARSWPGSKGSLPSLSWAELSSARRKQNWPRSSRK